ncbi:hypothetical protein GCM10028862_18040 [Luteimonas pelagia]
MRATWAIVAGLAAGIAVAWWLSRPGDDDRRAREDRASRAAAAGAEDARPKLYRWRDDAGNLQVTDTPPEGRPYDTVDIDPDAGIDVRGDRG